MKPVCMITGAGGHLGQALCCALSSRYDIIATYRRTVPAVSSQVRRHIDPKIEPRANHQPPQGIFCVQADLTRREDVRRLVEVSLARYSRIDALINSASDMRFHGKLVELWQADDYAQSQLFINCIAPMQLVSAIYENCWKDQPDENARSNRSVVNISSMSGLYVYPECGQAFYGASKAALNMLTLYLSLELAPYSVRANALCPGRFSDPLSTKRVVEAIQGLLDGASTGTVLSNFS